MYRETAAWGMFGKGELGNYGGGNGQYITYNTYGVRPVIEVLKSSL